MGAAAARLFLASSLVTALASPLVAQNVQTSVGTVAAAQQPQQPTTPPNPATSPTQNPAQNPAQNPGQIGGQTPPLSRPIPDRTVGLEPGKVVRWTMRDAIMAALDKNADIEIERENVKLAQFDLFSAKGVYDPLTSSNINYNGLTQPNAARFSGANSAQPSITNNTFTYNFGLQQLIEKGGSTLTVNFNNQRLASNVSNFTTQFSPRLSASFTQPLLRNFGTDTNRHLIKINRKRLDLSDALFRQHAIEIINQVQQAYWDLAFAIRNEQITRDAMKLAETQLNNNQRQVEVGTLAPIDVISTATVLESRRQDVFQAINAVAQAENALKMMTVEGPDADLWKARLEPVDSFDVQPVQVPLEDAVKLAFANRPEVRQYGIQKEMNKIDLAFFRNQTKPQVDFFGTYGMLGLGGTPALSFTCPPNSTQVPNAAQLACVDEGGNLVQPVQGPTPVFPGFVGGYGTSLARLFSQDYRTWTVGVNFSFPIRNRTAQANLGKALETGRQLDVQTRKQLQSIEVEVRNAVQSVATAKDRIDAARAAEKYAQDQLEGEQKKFQAGLSTTFLILTRQNDLSQARGVALRAVADYNKSIAELQRAVSTTLSSNNIEVSSDVPTSYNPTAGPPPVKK
jgi:outer membrane protein